MPKIQIDEIVEGENCPLIVNFQNGYPDETLEANDCCVLQDQKTGERSVAIVVDNLIYSGEVNQDDQLQYYILARNKTTGKARLIKYDTVNVKPELKCKNRTLDVVNTSALDLSRKFGSKKNKQMMEHREKLKVDAETAYDQLENVKANTTIDTIKEDMTDYAISNAEDFYIPPINRKADNINDVYDIDKILSPELFEKIITEIEDKDVTSEYNTFIKNIASNKKLSKQETVLALYANSLFLLYGLRMLEIAKKTFVACTSSHTLNEIVIKNFLSHVNNKRMRPPMYKDKALCHALVFCFLINNYKIDLQDLAVQAKLTPNSLITKAKVAGAWNVSSGNKKYLQLKLPLATANKKFGDRRKSVG